jgi:hypothetical protein
MTGGTDRPACQPAADVLADGVGTGVVAVGDADAGVTVGRGVTVRCGAAVRYGDVADGLGVRWRGVRLGEGVGVGVGEALCRPAELSPAALALGDGGLTHRYSTSVPRKTASSTQVEVRIRRIKRRSRWTRRPPAWAAG